jgi:hypothetical protein
MKVYENRMLMRIFGPKSEEIAASCRKLNIEKLHNLQSSANNRCP